MRRLPWAWLVALVVGIGAGLAFAWLAAPAAQPGNPPRSLRADYKDQWRESIAASYAVTGDLARARARLLLLGDADSVQTLSGQAQRALASGRPFEFAQELARLASDLQAGISSVPSRTQPPTTAATSLQTHRPASPQGATTTALQATTSPAAPSGTPTTAAAAPSPVLFPTPLPSPSAPFRLVSQDKLCDPTGKPGLLKVTVLNAQGSPAPGVEITITWDQGADRFFTGLQPEIGPGYADYTMLGGKTYSLQVARMGAPVSGIVAPICSSAAAQTYLGGLQLTFSTP